MGYELSPDPPIRVEQAGPIGGSARGRSALRAVSVPARRRLRGGQRVRQDAVDQAPLPRLLRRHEVVAVEVALDLLAGPAAVAGVEGDQPLPPPGDRKS